MHSGAGTRGLTAPRILPPPPVVALRSGADKTALEGAPTLAALVQVSATLTPPGRTAPLVIVAGGGVTPRNLARIVATTGVTEVHLSGRAARPSVMVYRNPVVSMGGSFGPPEFTVSVADPATLRACSAVAVTAALPTHTS